MSYFHRALSVTTIFALTSALCIAQQSDQSGTFVLHKFAKAIGAKPTPSRPGDTYTLTSHFLFTDRGERFRWRRRSLPRGGYGPGDVYREGKSSRIADMDDTLTVNGDAFRLPEPAKPRPDRQRTWFITDGYSPVAMQEQMMRWWLTHGQPAEFTVYPSKAMVHILPAYTLTVAGLAAHGYTVSGLIWGQESLWMDDAQNLSPW